MKDISSPQDRSYVLVTGASSGIVKATAKRLAANGYHVFAAARRVEKMTDLESAGITVLPLDITKEESVRSKQPRSRYAEPFESKFFLFLKWLLSDRLFDQVILSEINKRQKLVPSSTR